MDKVWDKSKYVFIFLFVFLGMSVFLSYTDADVLWNYGFSYAISRGEIPYSDFNMILTPLYPFLMSLGLLINSNILVFYIENSLLITLMFYFLFKMYGNKAWLFILFLIFPIPVVIYPSYNLLLLFLLIVLFYLEENKKNDYLIGVILGLLVLTKQTVGVALLLVSIIYNIKDFKKIGRRLLGFIGPCLVFLLYLLATSSFFDFFNHCLFGLLDFTGTNAKVDSIFFVISIVLLGVVICFIVMDRKNIFNWYMLGFFIIVVPLFDISHVAYFLFALLLLVLKKSFRFDERIIKYYLLVTFVYAGMFFFSTTYKGFIYPNHYNNFNFRVLYNANGENSIRDRVIEFVNENKSDKRIVFFASDAYFYKITCGMDIDHFDLLNYGNHGYDGVTKIKKKIKDLPSGTIMIIDTSGNGEKNAPQFMEEVADYAASFGEEIEVIADYTVYKKK